MVVNVVTLNKLNEQHTQIESQRVSIIKTKAELKTTSESLKLVEGEKTTIDASLKQEREKAHGLEQENQSLKVNLQAKKEREAQQAEVARLAAETPTVAAVAPPSGNCSAWLAQAGITHPIAVDLISRESGCNPCIVNGGAVDCNYSGDRAYGIPQALPGNKMASHGADWKTNPVTQLRWMQDYVMGRYGSWEAAKAHHDRVNWY